ncbi:MAG: PIN domain nuclease [Magnetococcales bacterium]|nr:PIN domain nuclease [Magnetococcales bacterium]
MTLVDSSVWIDYFNGRITAETDLLHDLLKRERILTGDIILTEVLQGFRNDADFQQARTFLSRLEFREMLGWNVALHSAENYRSLRKRGITVRKTIDLFIASFCILEGHALLHADRDYQPFEEYLGLVVSRPD